jgi:hypothetical protein
MIGSATRLPHLAHQCPPARHKPTLHTAVYHAHACVLDLQRAWNIREGCHAMLQCLLPRWLPNADPNVVHVCLNGAAVVRMLPRALGRYLLQLYTAPQLS